MPETNENELDVSIVMPCLNEAKTLPKCIELAMRALREAGVKGEVVIGDNGSTDGSGQLARDAGCQVASVPERGYGAALLGAIAVAKGRYILMGDADFSYDFTELPRFLEKLRAGNDLVMGNRFRGEIQRGAMPFLHRYLGNPVLTAIGRLFFRTGVGDFHCGIRAFNRQSIVDLHLACTGMEFASEMVVKASLRGLKIVEVPATLRPDERGRPPHLRTWRDGWRHLSFLLVYSPRWLFFYPGLVSVCMGALVMAGALLPPEWYQQGFSTDATLSSSYAVLLALLGAALTLTGAQAVIFFGLSSVYAITHGLLPQSPTWKKSFSTVTLEHGLVLGSLSLFAGVTLGVFGVSADVEPLRLGVLATVLLALGTQTILASFFLSLLGMPTGRRTQEPSA